MVGNMCRREGVGRVGKEGLCPVVSETNRKPKEIRNF